MPKPGKKPSQKNNPRSKKTRASAEHLSVSKVFSVLSQSAISSALEAANIGIWEWNAADNSFRWSENASQILGLHPSDFDGTFETYLNMVHPDDRQELVAAFRRGSKSAKAWKTEHRLAFINGSVRWMEICGRPLQGRKKFTGTIQEISARKSVEFDLEDWKTRHDLVTSSAGIVIYDYDIRTGRIVWSGNVAEVLGYNRRELGNIDNWVRLIHPQDRPSASALLDQAQEKLDVYDVNYRFKRKQGDYIHVHDRGSFIADDHGVAMRMIGMMSDQTARVRAEKTITENHHFRESLENAMPGILYVFDIVNKSLLYANKNIESVLGYSLSDLRKLGSGFVATLFHPDDTDTLIRWEDEPDGTVKETEHRMLRRDGKYRYLLTRDTPFKRDRNGKVIQVIGIAQDITIRKEVMNQLNQSEESFRELFDTVGEAICILRADQSLIDANRGACELFGYSKKDLIGVDPKFLSAENRNDIEGLVAKFDLAMKGLPQAVEFWGRKKNGEEILLEVRLTKGTYFGQQIIIATGRDVTERRLAEVALKESEQRFRTLQQASFGGIGLHDMGLIIDCNQGLCDITGYDYKELIGFNGLELIAPEWRPFVLEKIKSGHPDPYDVEGLRKDGSRYSLEIQGRNIPYHGRQIRVTEFRDITARKKAEAKIIEQNLKLVSVTEDLLRKNEQLEEFTQIVSHNLRAPIGNVATLLSFFENAKSDAEREEYFALIKESSAITLTMLNDVNDVLKIKQSKNIEKSELAFQQVFQQVRTMLNAKITQSHAEVLTDFAEPNIHYPPIYLESIMLNLLDNALKYSHPARKPKISFRTYTNRNGQLLMEVADNGLGLNLEKYGHQVFKLRKTFHRHPESRGIGLFMIKNQIEAMGGDISLSSKENEGSVFFINFNKEQ